MHFILQFFGITVVSGEYLLDHDFLFHCLFSSSHFSLTTFCVSSLQFFLAFVYIFFYIILPLFLCHFQCNPRRNFGLPRLHFPSTFWASACFSSASFFYMTSPCTPHQFLLRTFLHSNFHSHFILFPDQFPRLFIPGWFSQIWIFCCFSVSAIVSSAFMCAGVTHELSTFPLRLRDINLYPITPSTFLQAFAPAEILIVTKAINLVDYAQGNATSCHEFVNCSQQAQMLFMSVAFSWTPGV